MKDSAVFHRRKGGKRLWAAAACLVLAAGAAGCPIGLIEFDDSTIKITALRLDEDLTAYIPAPRNGDAPVRSIEADFFAGIVEWEPAVGSGLFQAGTAYTATASLYTAAGYTFAGLRYGEEVLTPLFLTDRMAVVKMRFSETGSISNGNGNGNGGGSGDDPGVIIEWE